MRRTFVITSIIVIVFIAFISYFWQPVWWFMIIFGPLILIGIFDMIQSKHTIRRNFPLVGNLRYLMEDLRPKMYQYFVESDTNGTPINRMFRSIVYERSKLALDTSPFGTEFDVYQAGYEWMNHSIAPVHEEKLSWDIRTTIGGSECKQPYSSSLLNISAMSFGALSKSAVRALNAGAKIGGFAHNTGEGGLSSYHLENGGDITWQIGTGYFGARNQDGTFSEEKFAEKAVHPNVKMIEIKLSQGAKPGHGGILPACKNNEEIATIRGVEPYKDVVSPPFHTAFTTPLELMHFITKLRELSGGKPIGFKLCVGNKSEFIAICKAMIETGIKPDFVTVDGGEGGTGAAPLEFSNSVGMPLREGLSFVYNTLVGFDLKKDIKIIASGKVLTGFHLVRTLALGADLCNSARGMMLSLGCIQARECNNNRCPTGITTQDHLLEKGLVVNDKKIRVANFHKETMKAALELITAAGFDSADKVRRQHIYRRIDEIRVKTYEEIYPYIDSGSLLGNAIPAGWENDVQRAKTNSFSLS